jgi:solute carrier family 35 protein F1/2
MDSGIAPFSKTTRQPSASPIPSKYENGVDPAAQSVNAEEIERSHIRFNSPSVFFKTFWARFVSIWTKRFIFCLLAGQLVSLCITCTNVTTTELLNRGWALPTTQTFFL